VEISSSIDLSLAGAIDRLRGKDEALNQGPRQPDEPPNVIEIEDLQRDPSSGVAGGSEATAELDSVSVLDNSQARMRSGHVSGRKR
jgi:hypothetical protein